MTTLIDIIDSAIVNRLLDRISNIGGLDAYNQPLSGILQVKGLLNNLVLGDLNDGLQSVNTISDENINGNFGYSGFGYIPVGGLITTTEEIEFNQFPLAIAVGKTAIDEYDFEYLKLPTAYYTGAYTLDNCEALHMNVFDDAVNFYAVQNAVNIQRGLASTRLVRPFAALSTYHIYNNLVSTEDFTDYDRLLFYINSSNFLLDTFLQFYFEDTIGGSQYVNFGNIDTGWLHLDLDISLLDRSYITAYGFRHNNNAISYGAYIDDIVLYNSTYYSYRPVIISSVNGILDTELFNFEDRFNGLISLEGYTTTENEEFMVIYVPSQNMIQINDELLTYDSFRVDRTGAMRATITGRGQIRTDIVEHEEKSKVTLKYTDSNYNNGLYQSLGITAFDAYLDLNSLKVDIIRPRYWWLDRWQRDILEYTTVKGKNTLLEVRESILRTYPFLRGKLDINDSVQYPGAILLWYHRSNALERTAYDVWEYWGDHKQSLPRDTLTYVSYVWDSEIAILNENLAASAFDVAGVYWPDFQVNDVFEVYGSVANDGTYTVLSAYRVATGTEIRTNPAPIMMAAPHGTIYSDLRRITTPKSYINTATVMGPLTIVFYNVVTNTIVLSGNHISYISVGDMFYILGGTTTANRKEYTVATVTLTAGNTVLTTNETFAAFAGALTGYHVYFDQPNEAKSLIYTDNAFMVAGEEFYGLGDPLEFLPTANDYKKYMVYPNEFKHILPSNTGVLFLDFDKIYP